MVTTPSQLYRGCFALTKRPLLLAGILLMSVSWFLLWALTTFWNPIFFWGTWTGMALVTYDIGYAGHPGYKRHFMLSLTSIPLWWWFEVVNRRIMNWEYVSAFDYDPLQYFLFADNKWNFRSSNKFF